MAFYIRPPHGKLSLSNLHVYTENRLNLLGKISKCQEKFVAIKDVMEEESTVAMSDCLIEGSKKDQVSHFMLRLACSQNFEMADFFIQAESALFYYRLSCMTKSELYSMIKPIKRFYRYIISEGQTEGKYSLSNETTDVLNILEEITNDMTWEQLIQEYITGNSKRFIKISFQYVNSLIAKRLVFIERGLAFVPCQKLDVILKTVFETTLRHGMRVAARRLSHVKQDIRVKRLNMKIKKLFEGLYPQATYLDHKELVLSEEVDTLQHYFPPCMSHLYNSLRETHRLKHYSRVQYTLFLKELGLPVNEAIHFWQSEYSLQPKITDSSATDMKKLNSSRCHHSWEKDGKRYTYSIRHLYGLEGSRKNYKGHCCTSLQHFDGGSGEQGGCPFKQFDQYHLANMLSSQGIKESVKSEICMNAEISLYNEACVKFMGYKLLQQHKMKHKIQKIENSPSSKSETLHLNDAKSKCLKYDPNGKSNYIVNEKHNIEDLILRKRHQTSFNSSYTTSDQTFKVKRRKTERNSYLLNNDTESALNNTVSNNTLLKTNIEIPTVKIENNNEKPITEEVKLMNYGCKEPMRMDITQSCYDHDSCPPSQKVCLSPKSVLSQTLSQCTGYNKTKYDEDLSVILNNKSIVINRPVDYYQTYKSLLEGLLT